MDTTMTSYDREVPDIMDIGATSPKAQKEYTCYICGKPIKKGEKHRKFAYKDEDRKFQSVRYHFACPYTDGV